MECRSHKQQYSMAAPSCRIIIASGYDSCHLGKRRSSVWRVCTNRIFMGISGDNLTWTPVPDMLGSYEPRAVLEIPISGAKRPRGPDRILEYSCTLCEHATGATSDANYIATYTTRQKPCVPCRGYQLLQRYGYPSQNKQSAHRRIRKVSSALLLRCQDSASRKYLPYVTNGYGPLLFGCILGTDRILQRPLWQQRGNHHIRRVCMTLSAESGNSVLNAGAVFRRTTENERFPMKQIQKMKWHIHR